MVSHVDVSESYQKKDKSTLTYLVSHVDVSESTFIIL
jgi:hypothetical protein